MFDVKVKTLDGRTHEFSVEDEVTVLQFKEIISGIMDIAVDRQRLLYQGRVLVDENLLSSYEVAGNVMHLVTRLPPQSRPATDQQVEREENSDINRDQIRNILSDVLNNIGDLNNPMGVSVNNEGSRMDITVNIPTQNRLSLSRLRQNYVLRLLDQARSVINHMDDPSITAPRPDRDRLRQADPYDIGANEERLIDVTSQPLPISNLADMITQARSLWSSAEPQLELWESVLRRENGPDSTARSDGEMQRIHDSASRYVHMFSHVLHILSDYLVEFQPGIGSNMAAPRVTPTTSSNVETTITTADASTTANVDDNNAPLTNACGESGMVLNNEPISAATAPTTEIPTTEISDRSRYLYVFSEMPAQLVQVRVDVDSNIRDIGTTPVTQTTTPTTTANIPQPRSAEIVPPTDSSSNTAQANPEAPNARTRPQRRGQLNGNTVENMFRNTIQNTLMGSNVRPQMTSGSRTMRSGPQFMDSVDPYIRCQSRHFQHPSNLRSGAVISTISNIRLMDGPRQRPNNNTDNTTPTSTANVNTTPTTNVRSQSTDTDPMRSLINGLMNSIFPGPGDSPRSPAPENGHVPVEASTNAAPIVGSDIQRILQTFAATWSVNINTPLTQIFPEMLSNQEVDPGNFVTNQIVQIVVNRLTFADLMGIVHGQYTPLNQLRVPLQEILANHQREVGSRELLVDHVVSDLEFFNRAYITVFENLRNGELHGLLSEEARNSFNMRLDIFQTINNLNRYHFQSVIDMIMRSPTNQGFGQLLMNSLTLHHNESLAVIDIICNNNDELRKFLIKSFLDSLMVSINTSSTNSGSPLSPNMLGLELIFDDTNNGLFRRPEQLEELREHALSNFAVYYSENGNAATSSHNDESPGIVDSIEDMVTNLSENIINGAIITELERPILSGLVDGEVVMDTCSAGQGEGPSVVINGGERASGGGGTDWQTVLPAEWIHVITRDSNSALDAETLAVAVPFSDAYVSAMPPKRRKVIVSQRTVQPSLDMMQTCLDQAIKSAGLAGPAEVARAALPSGMHTAFRDVVTERVQRRLVDERHVFPAERFPFAEHNFNRDNQSEDDNKRD